MGFLASFLAGFLPMFLYAWLLYMLDRYEKEPWKLLFGVFSWGAIVAAGAAYIINSVTGIGIYLITQSDFATQLTLSTLVAPVVEETLKGAAVLIIFLLFRSEFDSPLDGLVYGGITALGFAATENFWYIHRLGFLENSWEGLLNLTLIRSVLVGWQHPFYTSFTGLGFALSRRASDKTLAWFYPIAGCSLAVVFHFLHNLFSSLFNFQYGFLLSTIWDWSGYLAILVFIFVLINREQRWMKEYLYSEHSDNLLTKKQYQTACSAWRQSLVFLQARIKGVFSETRLFYQTCGDLMHKKRQLIRHGEESGNSQEIQRLKKEIQLLSEKI